VIETFVKYINELRTKENLKELVEERKSTGGTEEKIDERILKEIYNEKLFDEFAQYINDLGMSKEIANLRARFKEPLMKYAEMDLDKNELSFTKDEIMFEVLFGLSFVEVMTKVDDELAYFMSQGLVRIEGGRLTRFFFARGSNLNYNKLEKIVYRLNDEKKKEIEETYRAVV